MNDSSVAKEFQADYLSRKVLNLDVAFHWIAGADRFWFKREARSGAEFVLVDAQTAEQSIIAEPNLGRTEPAPADGVVSPNGLNAVVRHAHDLWLRNLSNSCEQRLTHDGTENFAYGEGLPTIDTCQVARRREGRVEPPHGVLWSPDGRFVVAFRQDLRLIPERPYVTEYVPAQGSPARVHFRRVPVSGDVQCPPSELSVLDVSARTVRKVAMDAQAMHEFAAVHFMTGIVWWTGDCNSLFLLTANRGGSCYAHISVDLRTGETRQVIQEQASFNVRLNPVDYARPNVHVLSNGAEFVWYSERSGYGHLYLYDGKGRMKYPLTHGEWVIFDLLRIDEERRLVYFTAGSQLDGANPYYRYLYCVSLDGGEPQLLTPEIADHKFDNPGGLLRVATGVAAPYSGSCLSPSGRYFVDSYSTTEQPPEYVLRRSSGEFVSKVLSSDASALYATGWRPPERLIAKAADGVTDLYGTITKPRNFDLDQKYPVIDSMYPGPQGSWAPRTFADTLEGGSIHHLQTFADAGFIVIALDGRGTAHRSRAFRDAFLGTEDVLGAADHVAAIKDLAARCPYMDLERLGVRGQSFGGYGSLRAMLLYPEFFKVGVCATGPGEWLDFRSGINAERFFGVPAESVLARDYYDTVSNARLASRLQGRVLLIYGALDENVPLNHAFVLFDAFIKADKDIDMLILPDSTHAAPTEPYAIRRSIQYFVEHLNEPQRQV